MSGKNSAVKQVYNWVLLVIVIGVVVLLNIIGSFVYSRIDMTEDARYSLSEGTVEFLEKLNPSDIDSGNPLASKKKNGNRLLLKIYLDGNLPAELKRFKNAVQDKLKEFKEYAGDRIEYQFIDPTQGTEADQQLLFGTLYDKGKGIIPMEIAFNKDGAQTQMMTWPGAVLEYGGETKNVIQLLPGTQQGKYNVLNEQFTSQIQNTINNLEYILVSSIRRATQQSKPRIAFIQGHGELRFAETQRVRALIDKYYTVEDIALNDSINALNGVKGVIIARPTQPYSDKDKYILDQFLLKGGRLMCFVDKLTFPIDSLNLRGNVHTTRLNTKLDDMLFDYGIKINDNYAVDVRCAPKTVPMAKQSLIPWFFHIAATQTKHPISRNIDPVMLRYVSEIQFVGTSNKRVVSPILTTSTNSTVTGMAPMVSLALPMNYGKSPVLVNNPTSEVNKKCIAGLVEGRFESHYKNRIVDAFSGNKDAGFKEESTSEGKLLVVANGDFIRNYYDSMPNAKGQMQYRPISFNNLRFDETMAQYEGSQPLIYGNQEFFQNLVDYMMGDNSVLDLRSRQIDIHPIDTEKVKTNAGFYKALNMILPSSLVILFAFILFYLRKRRFTRS